MKVVCIGGGPASLYFSVLLKKERPDADITVYERDPENVTWGFGVVFSDATMAGFGDADEELFLEISRHFTHWDDIDVHFKGEVLRSTGHGFAGLARLKLLQILAARARELGVTIHYDTRVSDISQFADCDLIVAGDGVNSVVRERFKDHFQPKVEVRPNKFIWLGAEKTFGAFTFYFKKAQHGLWRAHCYQYEEGEHADGNATVIVECTEETWGKAGLDGADEAKSVTFCQNLLAEELDGAQLVSNNSTWRSFPRLSNARWSHGNIVLLGDALHTAHFSIGSGTKLAMEDAIALVAELAAQDSIPAAMTAFEVKRRPEVESL